LDIEKHGGSFTDVSKFKKALTSGGKTPTPFPKNLDIPDKSNYPGRQITQKLDRTTPLKDVVKAVKSAEPRDILTSKPRGLPYGLAFEDVTTLSYPQTQTAKLIQSKMGYNKVKPKTETMLFSKSALSTGLKSISSQSSKSKQLQKALLETRTITGTKQKALTRQDIKEKYKLTPLLREKLELVSRQRTKVITVPRLKQAQAQKTRVITVPRLRTKLIIKEKLVPRVPPPKTTFKVPPAPPLPLFQLPPRKEKKKKKKKGKDTEEFLGSTFESSVLGFRSKKFDITYSKKKIGSLLTVEKKKFAKPKWTSRGKSSLSKNTPKKLVDNYQFNKKKNNPWKKSRVRLF